MAEIDRQFVTRAMLVGLLAVSVGLSACGRKGALEAPVGSIAAKDDGMAAAATDEEKAKQKPDKAFILDPLLK